MCRVMWFFPCGVVHLRNDTLICVCGRFTGDVKLKAIRLCGGDEGAHPAELRL